MSARHRWFLIGACLLLFLASAGLVIHFLPRPLSRGDYLVAGSIATLLTLLALFIYFLVAGFITGRFGRKR